MPFLWRKADQEISAKDLCAFRVLRHNGDSIAMARL